MFCCQTAFASFRRKECRFCGRLAVPLRPSNSRSLMPALMIFMLGGGEAARYVNVSRALTNLAFEEANLVAERPSGSSPIDIERRQSSFKRRRLGDISRHIGAGQTFGRQRQAGLVAGSSIYAFERPVHGLSRRLQIGLYLQCCGVVEHCGRDWRIPSIFAPSRRCLRPIRRNPRSRRSRPMSSPRDR